MIFLKISLMKRKAFTLIELLVVIAIIALLMSIVIPSLRKAKDHTRKVLCANNERQMSFAFMIYSNENSGYLPLQFNVADSYCWAWNISYWTTDLIIDSGSMPDVFYCPSNPVIKQGANDDIWWRFQEIISLAPQRSMSVPEPTGIETRKMLSRVSTYCFILDSMNLQRNEVSPLEGSPSRRWLSRMNHIKSPSSAELITDTVITQNGTFTEVNGGHWIGWQVFDSTNHVTQKGDIEGQNIIFADGSSKWKTAKELQNSDGTYRYRTTANDVHFIW